MVKYTQGKRYAINLDRVQSRRPRTGRLKKKVLNVREATGVKYGGDIGMEGRKGGGGN